MENRFFKTKIQKKKQKYGQNKAARKTVKRKGSILTFSREEIENKLSKLSASKTESTPKNENKYYPPLEDSKATHKQNSQTIKNAKQTTLRKQSSNNRSQI